MKKILSILIIALFAISAVSAADNETVVKPDEFPVLTYENYTDPEVQSVENLTRYESGVYLTIEGEIDDFHESYVFMYDEDILYEVLPNGKVKVSEYQVEIPEILPEDEDFTTWYHDEWFDIKYPQPACYFEIVLGNITG